MNEPKNISVAGKERVEKALKEHGLLLIQGQWEIPSLADLLKGKPITTKGYSWDYVPAWKYSDGLTRRPHLAFLKLFRGKNTIVEKAWWPYLHILALKSVETVLAGKMGKDEQRFLQLVCESPGISGEKIKEKLKINSNDFQKIKNNLEKWLCIWGIERSDVECHTHDQAWWPWKEGKIAKFIKTAERVPTPEEAQKYLSDLIQAQSSKKSTITLLFPVLKVISKI